jgi:hypothetical protein
MNRSRVLAIAGVFALSACGGGSVGSPSSPGQAMVPQTAAANAALSPDKKKRKLAHLTFHFKLPSKHHHASSSERITPNFIPASTQKVTVILNTVNGHAPPSGITLKKTTLVTQATCGGGSGCTVAGPASPPGNDSFTVNIKGNSDAVLSTATKTFTIKLATANTGSLTLNGVPASFSIVNAPTTGTAGTPVGATAVQVLVYDAAGDKITGTFASPVSLASSDASVQFAPLQSTSSTTGSIAATFTYSGLAVAPVTLSASATGATTATSLSTPSLTAPNSVCNGDGSGTTECATPGPQVNLYSPTSTGSTATFTASQTGWTGGYNKTFTENDTCSGIATITTTDNLTFTATAANNATANTCNVTVTGGANQTVVVPITYTTSVVGVSGRHRKPKSPHS